MLANDDPMRCGIHTVQLVKLFFQGRHAKTENFETTDENTYCLIHKPLTSYVMTLTVECSTGYWQR